MQKTLIPLPAAWQTPRGLLYLLAAGAPLSFALWQALLNNFAIERAGFTGAQIGTLQSLREVPGFLAFTFVFLLFFLNEQRVSLLSLLVLGLGTALTGLFPSSTGLYLTTVLMSVGFHYNETALQSLSLQWTSKAEAPRVLGRIVSIGAFASLLIFGVIQLTYGVLHWDYQIVYLLGGISTALLVAVALLAFPTFTAPVAQSKKLFLRRRYWLFYALTFFGGARRQIFVVFAGFLMVERFHYGVVAMTWLIVINQLVNLLLAPAIGKLISRLGERRSLLIEQAGLVAVFIGYAYAPDEYTAGALYIADNLFFAMAIAVRTYFQKIADPADIAPSSGVSFSINHIAAVVLPFVFGQIWMRNPSEVFLLGAGLAFCALLLSRLVPLVPRPGQEVSWPGQGGTCGEGCGCGR